MLLKPTAIPAFCCGIEQKGYSSPASDAKYVIFQLFCAKCCFWGEQCSRWSITKLLCLMVCFGFVEFVEFLGAAVVLFPWFLLLFLWLWFLVGFCGVFFSLLFGFFSCALRKERIPDRQEICDLFFLLEKLTWNLCSVCADLSAEKCIMWNCGESLEYR